MMCIFIMFRGGICVSNCWSRAESQAGAAGVWRRNPADDVFILSGRQAQRKREIEIYMYMYLVLVLRNWFSVNY